MATRTITNTIEYKGQTLAIVDTEHLRHHRVVSQRVVLSPDDEELSLLEQAHVIAETAQKEAVKVPIPQVFIEAKG